MNKKIVMLLALTMLYVISAQAGIRAKISAINGEVKIRRGVEETWLPAKKEMILEEIDTILTGKDAEVTIDIDGVGIFVLGSQAVIDIGDLRSISEKEMFLYLMSNKIKKMEPASDRTKLRIGNVSVIHGEKKAEHSTEADADMLTARWILEFNGAASLYEQKYYINTIVKLIKIMTNNPDIQDCGKIHFYLGKSFEAINQKGQAIDAYEYVIYRAKEQNCLEADIENRVSEAQTAIERLAK